MPVPVDRLPVTVTTFALGEAYLRKLDGLLESVQARHPGWTCLAGRCLPPPGGGTLAFEVAGDGKDEVWEVPVPLRLDGGEDDWRRVTRLKGWWMDEVWRRRITRGGENPARLLWLDVEVRLRQPLAFEVDPAAETVAGPWWQDPEGLGRDILTSGVLLAQGTPGGPVSDLLAAWRESCLAEIAALPPRTLPWKDGDQEVLNDLLQGERRPERGFSLLKLPHDAYCAGRSGTAADASTIAEHGGVR